jgi:hypothetical protein
MGGLHFRSQSDGKYDRSNSHSEWPTYPFAELVVYS